MDADQFIARWSTATISERAHYQTFISQLCALIGAPAPDEEKAGDLDYCFERPVRFSHEDGSGGHVHYIDCYRRDCFVLEAKQSGKRQSGGELDPRRQLELFAGRGRKPAQLSDDAWDRLMRAAKRQAEGYAKALDECRRVPSRQPLESRESVGGHLGRGPVSGDDAPQHPPPSGRRGDCRSFDGQAKR